MNNKIIGGVVIVLVIVAALYFSMKKGSNLPTNSETNTVASSQSSANTASNVSQNNSGPASLKDLLALGTTQKCTFSDSGSSGTFYVGGGKARGDFSATEAGKVLASHMIMDGQTSYIWMDGQAQGFKMSAQASSSTTNPAVGQSSAPDVNKKMDYKCEAAVSDSSMFKLPSGVTFVDIAAMMQQPK